jgi:hypothetical protein
MDAAAWLKQGPKILAALLIALVVAGLIGNQLNLVTDTRQFTAYLFISQDLRFSVAIIFICYFAMRAGERADHGWMDWLGRHPWLMIGALFLICWVGHSIVFLGRPLTRDEQMAVFDSTIFNHDRLAWPVAPEWRTLVGGLNDTFLLPVAEHSAWVSGYLPVNAALRTLIGGIADPDLTSPLMVAIGAVALWRISVRIWPDDVQPRVVALLLYCGSSQIVLMGMTAYAMSGHLALNLVWLWLFLRGGKVDHAAALVIGFLATGLHQPLFHPLFVLPFLIGLVPARRWPLVAFYGVGYLVIGLFWLSWPHMVALQVGGVEPLGQPLGYGSRIVMLLKDVDATNLWLMALNLLRFLSWQHLFFLPLVATGMALCWRRPLVRPLAAGIALHLLAVTILLAYQAHGWGYRYVHGILGNACLLGGFGWARVRQGLTGPRIWAGLNLATFLVALPIHAVMAYRIAKPYAAVSAAIDRTKADIVIVHDGAAAFAADLAINRPDLSNRPIRMVASHLSDSDVRSLCTRYRVAFVGRDELAPIQAVVPAFENQTIHFADLRRACSHPHPNGTS